MDNLWEKFEEKIPDNNFAIDTKFSCDICSKVLNSSGNEKWRMIDMNIPRSREEHYDFCFDCYDKLFDQFKIIDRTDYSIEQKPINWPCYFCHEKQGGGCKWYNFKEIDICTKCYAKKLDFDAFIFDPSNKNLKIVIRCSEPCILDLSDVPNGSVPKELENEIYPCRMDDYADCLGSCVHLDPNFGPVKEWAIFTKMYDDFPSFEADTALLVNCSEKRNGMIASMCMDNHGRTSFDIVYNNLDDYLKEFQEWQKNRITNQEEFERVKVDVLNKLEENGSIEEEEYAQILTEFSGYIRIVKKLPIYFG